MEIIQICHYQFMGNSKVEEDRNMLANLVQSYKVLACNMSLKMFFLEFSLRLLPRKSQESER